MEFPESPVSALSLKTVIDRHPLIVAPDTLVIEAINLMSRGRNTCLLTDSTRSSNSESQYRSTSSCVLVIEAEALVGLLTERDLVKLAVRGLPLEGATVAEVMTRNVIAMKESELEDAFSVLKVFRQHRIRHLPIVNARERVVGLITPHSIRQVLQPGDLLKLQKVGELMSKEVIYAPPDTSVRNLVELMVKKRISCVVIAREKTEGMALPVGIVTERDIVQFQALALDLQRLEAQTVMSTPLFCLSPEDSLWTAHQEMQKRRVRRLVVAGSSGELLGIITQTSFMLAIDPLEMHSTIRILQQEIKERRFKSEQQFDRDRLLATIAQRIRQSLELDEILNTTVAEVRQLLQVDRVIISNFDSICSGIVIVESVCDQKFSILGKVIKDYCFESSWLETYKQGKSRAIEDIYTAHISQCDLEILTQYQVRANLVVPIILAENQEGEAAKQSNTNGKGQKPLWGLLIAHQCSGSRYWEPSEIEFIEKLAIQVAIAIQQSMLLEQARKEVVDRQQYEIALEQAKDELEIKVRERTALLQQVNEQLEREIRERQQAQEALQQVNQQLASKVEELKQRQEEMTLLSNAINFLQVCLTLEEAYQAIATLIQPLFPGSSGALFVVNSANNLVEAVATWGTDLKTETVFPSNECWALRRSCSHWVEFPQAGLRCQHIHPIQSKSQSLCVPLTAQGEAMWMLYLHSPSEQLTPAKRKLALTATEQTSLALANLKLRETLQHKSIRDPLTGLFNRRYMEEFLEQELSRAQRKQHPIGTIVLDIDYFKHFNDNFGHEAGDLVLRQVSIFLRQHVRKSDIVCRYGGEEIVMIMPESSLENTSQRAEQLRQGIKQLELKHRDRDLGKISVSIGVACFPKHGSRGPELIQAADAALYRAKAQGRDRVTNA